MNIFEKLQKIKIELLKCDMKKSGFNGFGNFKYFDLNDITEPVVKLCDDYKIHTVISFSENEGILAATNIEKPEEKVVVTIPTEKFENAKMNKIQVIGWITTYIRRYLYMSLFDITENDTFDAASGKPEIAKKTESKKYCCVDCKTEFKAFTDKKGKTWNAGQVYHMAESNNADKKARCRTCREKLKGGSQKW